MGASPEVEVGCPNCKKSVKLGDVKTVTMPNNMHIMGLDDDSKIPECPECKELWFFGPDY